jgi:transposase
MERLHMNYLRDVVYRLRCNESERRIARDLGISRITVAKYRAWAALHGYLESSAAMPDDAMMVEALGLAPHPPRAPSGVESFREIVTRLLDQQVEMTAIYQRLQENYGYSGSYSSVRRFVQRMRPSEPCAVVRVHTAPGEELQVDFGRVGRLFDPVTSRLRTAYVFVSTLSYSRHQYAELVFDQKVSTWIALHRHAFESFGGVPRRIVVDNLKAAVQQVLVHDPVLGEAYRRMAQHYQFVISPTRPYTPQHKGKVESGVHYIQRNFMAGQEFADIDAANQRLKIWVQERAGAREHGTTHHSPLALFHSYEEAQLLPLPEEPFTLCEVKLVKVHPDCHVVIAGSFYSVPYAYVGQTLDAYVSERMVEIFRCQELVTTHMRSVEVGEWHTRLEHYPEHKAAYLQRTPTLCRQIAARLGPATSQVVETLLADGQLDRLRSVQAILRMEERVGADRLEAACARAVYFADPRYRRIKDILNAALDREPLPESSPTLPLRPFVFARSTLEFFALPGGREA